jgi:hypothetical protein
VLPVVSQGLSWLPPVDTGGPALVHYRVYRALGVVSTANVSAFTLLATVPLASGNESAAVPRVWFNASTANPLVQQAMMPNTTYVVVMHSLHGAVCTLFYDYLLLWLNTPSGLLVMFEKSTRTSFTFAYSIANDTLSFNMFGLPHRYSLLVTAESQLVEGLLTQSDVVTGTTPPPIPCPNSCSGHGACGAWIC